MRDWNRLPKRQRADWIAFQIIEGQAERYAMHEEGLEARGVSLLDWIRMEEHRQDLKIKSIKKAQEKGLE